MNDSPVSTGPPRLVQILRLWFGVTQRVDQKSYALSGFGLMLFKYAVEAAICQSTTGQLFTPLDFLNPSMSGRQAKRPGRTRHENFTGKSGQLHVLHPPFLLAEHTRIHSHVDVGPRPSGSGDCERGMGI